MIINNTTCTIGSTCYPGINPFPPVTTAGVNLGSSPYSSYLTGLVYNAQSTAGAAFPVTLPAPAQGAYWCVANWYNGQPAHKLAVQVCKYQSRTKEGSQTWSHVDVLRKAHVKPITPAHNAVMKYVTAGWTSDQLAAFRPAKDNPFNYIAGHELAKKAASADQIVKLIDEYGLMRESIPTQFLKDKKVWDKLLDGMPMTAMIRS